MDWCWSWNSNTLATCCRDLTHLKRPWFWERLSTGGKGDDRGWDGWMVSLTQWTWIWVDSRSCWWTGKHGVLQSMGSQRVGYYWATELNWTVLSIQVSTRKPFLSSELNLKSVLYIMWTLTQYIITTCISCTAYTSYNWYHIGTLWYSSHPFSHYG